MGERKGVNKYYPPDFDYKKHGSLDRYHNSHPLRERAKKIGEGILVIRFEMPYNIWCNGCNIHIGMGVRYNAEKIKVGNYYSTPVYKFKMKCALCPQYFEIQTDPANCDYVILSGARRKEERWNAKDNEQIEMTDHLDKKKLMTDAMFKLEHNVKDQRKLQNALPTLEEIQDLQEEKRDDYILNKILRKRFRDKKKVLESTAKQDQVLLDKSSLDIKLVPEDERDKTLAKLITYDTVKSFSESQSEARNQISTNPVLKSTSTLGNSDKLTSKLPKSLGSVLSKSLTKPDLWDQSPKGSKRSNSSSSASILGVKIAKKSTKQSRSQQKIGDKSLTKTALISPAKSSLKTALKDSKTDSELRYSGDTSRNFEIAQKSLNSNSEMRPNCENSVTEHVGSESRPRPSTLSSVGRTRTSIGSLVASYSDSSSSSDGE